MFPAFPKKLDGPLLGGCLPRWWKSLAFPKQQKDKQKTYSTLKHEGFRRDISAKLLSLQNQAIWKKTPNYSCDPLFFGILKGSISGVHIFLKHVKFMAGRCKFVRGMVGSMVVRQDPGIDPRIPKFLGSPDVKYIWKLPGMLVIVI